MNSQRRRSERLPATEYVVLEGRLCTATNEPNSRDKKLAIVDRDTGGLIECVFEPTDADAISAHAGHRACVEGWLSLAEGPPTLRVVAFQLIPKAPITLEEIRGRGLRTPGGQSPESFVRSLRSP